MLVATRPRLTFAPLAKLRQVASLVASWTPGALFAVGLLVVRSDERFAWIADPMRYPWELFAVALSGGAATLAGTWDWLYHRQQGVAVGPVERRVELIALGCGGVPLFGLMAAATVASEPIAFLIPVVLALVFTTVLVVYDEVRFHRRRCSRFEHVLHRTLTVGHLGALLAWMHFVFVRGGGA